MVGLRGANGAGKTTTLRMLATPIRLDPRRHGRIAGSMRVAHLIPSGVRQSLGLCLGDDGRCPTGSRRGRIFIFIRPAARLAAAAADHRSRELAQLLDLAVRARIGRPGGSPRQRQRVSLGRAPCTIRRAGARRADQRPRRDRGPRPARFSCGAPRVGPGDLAFNAPPPRDRASPGHRLRDHPLRRAASSPRARGPTCSDPTVTRLEEHVLRGRGPGGRDG